jgi:hypothetical protein
VRQKILEKRRKSIKKSKPSPVIFDWLKISDLPACLRLDQIVYDEEIDLGPIETYQSWRKKNQNISVAAFDANDRNIMLGYVGLVPVVNERICLDILRGKRPDHSITVDEIDTYDRDGAFILYAISACTHPSRPDLLLPMLLKHVEFWQAMYPTRYIKKIFAQAVSERGEMLVQHMFMAPRPDLAYNAYELDIARPSASRVIRSFQRRLSEISPLPLDLQWPPTIEVTQTRDQRIQPSVSKETTLPISHRGYTEFYRVHGIPETTAGRANETGVFRIVTDGWKVNGVPVKKALDREAQIAFCNHFCNHEKFQRCSVDDCPCHTEVYNSCATN